MTLKMDSKPWTDDVVKTYLTATAQQKDDPEKFYDTHLDIDKIYAESLGGAYQDEFVTQEEFRDELLNAAIDEDIRTFILRGETGSGKSQLCQWLDYELAGKGTSGGAPDRIPLHIKANQTNLEHIIATLAEPLGEDPEIRQVTALNATKVATAIITNLEANPGQTLADADIDRIIDNGELLSLLEENIAEYQRGLEQQDETEFDPNLLTKDDYRDLALALGTDSVFHKNSDILRKALRDEIHRHFSHIIGVDDFQGQLREYAQRYVDELGKRPVIICEDVTTFSVLKEQLLDQIIQVESATYDIVLGYTTGFEQEDLQDALGNRGDEDALTYLKDRAEGYLSLTQDGVAYFLNNTLAVDLVQRYMDVIKRESEAAIDPSVEAAFDDLYPFNRAFIQLAYDRLLEDGSPRRTPRVLLQKVVRRVLLSDDPPYVVVDKNPNVDKQVTPIDPSKYKNDLQKLSKWYGYVDNVRDDSNEILIHEGVLDAFGFSTDGEGTVSWEGETYVAFRPNEAASRILGESTDDRIGIPFSETAPPEPPKPGSTPPQKVDPPTRTEPPEQPTESGSGRREDQVNEFLEWIETGDDYPSSDVLRGGAESVLDMWYEPTKLANPNASLANQHGIYYTRGQNVPVSIEGPDERQGLSVLLPFGKEHLDLYFDLLEVGMNDGALPEEAVVERLRSWSTNSVVGFREEMREQIEGCFPSGLTLEHTILLGKFLLTNAEFGVAEVDRDTIFDRRTPKDRSYESPVQAAFSSDAGIAVTLGSLQDRRRDIESLVDGYFLLKKNLVDHDRLAPIRVDLADNPETYIKLAQQIDVEELEYPSAYNITTSRSSSRQTSLTTFLDAISDYAIELSRLGDEELESFFKPALGPVQKWHDASHRAADLGDLLDTLIDCLGVFGVTNEARWEQTQRALNSESRSIKLDEFNDAVSSFTDLETDSPLERMQLLHDFQVSKKEHVAWSVYQTFDEIIDRLRDYDVEENDDLETEIRKLEEIQDYETAKQTILEATDSYSQ